MLVFGRVVVVSNAATHLTWLSLLRGVPQLHALAASKLHAALRRLDISCSDAVQHMSKCVRCALDTGVLPRPSNMPAQGVWCMVLGCSVMLSFVWVCCKGALCDLFHDQVLLLCVMWPPAV